MIEKLLLHIYYESMRPGNMLNWDNIAHRLHPGSGGTAIQQHMPRLRKHVLQQGHMVPPPFTRQGRAVSKEVRGYILDDNATEVGEGSEGSQGRVVSWNEQIDDYKPFNQMTYGSGSDLTSPLNNETFAKRLQKGLAKRPAEDDDDDEEYEPSKRRRSSRVQAIISYNETQIDEPADDSNDNDADGNEEAVGNVEQSGLLTTIPEPVVRALLKPQNATTSGSEGNSTTTVAAVLPVPAPLGTVQKCMGEAASKSEGPQEVAQENSEVSAITAGIGLGIDPSTIQAAPSMIFGPAMQNTTAMNNLGPFGMPQFGMSAAMPGFPPATVPFMGGQPTGLGGGGNSMARLAQFGQMVLNAMVAEDSENNLQPVRLGLVMDQTCMDPVSMQQQAAFQGMAQAMMQGGVNNTAAFVHNQQLAMGDNQFAMGSGQTTPAMTNLPIPGSNMSNVGLGGNIMHNVPRTAVQPLVALPAFVAPMIVQQPIGQPAATASASGSVAAPQLTVPPTGAGFALRPAPSPIVPSAPIRHHEH